ncbi:prepilin peptidase-dependent protein [Orbus sasakiae]|uniref:Prepilin peptidase-dependent protein n=1 Tax=Orbus sasakiae TaxID=1078475 RepID=A0ABP9MZQ1_9GAMM
MLNRGFTLLEMLLVLIMIAMITSSIMAFYPRWHFSLIAEFQKNHLRQATTQALSGLIKDIKRAGFIANIPSTVRQSAIDINTMGNCIIIRYDANSRGNWHYDPINPQLSDIFAYRYVKHNLESQTGVEHCKNTASRWEKLFDPNEIILTDFNVSQHNHYIKLRLSVSLKYHTKIDYHVMLYIKNENS